MLGVSLVGMVRGGGGGVGGGGGGGGGSQVWRMRAKVRESGTLVRLHLQVGAVGSGGPALYP